jgi:hypothetical protein
VVTRYTRGVVSPHGYRITSPDGSSSADVAWTRARIGRSRNGSQSVSGVQIAAASTEVIASVHNPDNRDAIVGFGAFNAIDPSEAEANGLFDVVLELVGAPNVESDLRSLNVRPARSPSPSQ